MKFHGWHSSCPVYDDRASNSIRDMACCRTRAREAHSVLYAAGVGEVKKIFLLILTIAFPALAGSLAAAQQSTKRIPRIGILSLGKAPSIQAFRQGLHELGWVEGQNIAIVYRSADGNEERLLVVAAQLVGAHVDIIVSTSSRGTVASRQVTKSIPIVATFVGERLVNLGHPQENVTGVSSMPGRVGRQTTGAPQRNNPWGLAGSGSCKRSQSSPSEID